MAESDMRRKVVRDMRELHAVAVENPVYPGTPDVNYINGWVELKWLRNWPKVKTSPVVFKHYTQKQKIWMTKRHRAGGKVGLLVQCKREWLYFAYPALLEVGTLTQEELRGCCTHYTMRMTKEVLQQWLTTQ
jgi:hypothetical protein